MVYSEVPRRQAWPVVCTTSAGIADSDVTTPAGIAYIEASHHKAWPTVRHNTRRHGL